MTAAFGDGAWSPPGWACSRGAGIAAWNGTETSDELIARTDAGLYAAKAAGATE